MNICTANRRRIIMDNKWYKDICVYQIWPRSFCDGNGDGIGDLEGVYSKLDYIKDLGVDCIWFSPLYPSPNADFGYDIADYKNIHPEYGDLELFKKVLDGAHERGIKVIMDLVVNHTSDECDWFQKSRRRIEPYTDYYIWRKGRDGGKKPPNNWLSMFEGGAWEYDEVRGEYYLHVFAKKQPDLNHDNPKVREEVKEIMKFWLDMGVDGFREDVITFISKKEGLPNGFPIPSACGMEHYINGPHIHEYLREYREVAKQYDCFCVGEAPMMTPETALKYITEGDNQELDLMFHFQHMEADCIMMDFIHVPFSLTRMKKAFTRWQNMLKGKAWNTLYIENHDHPRIISRYGSEAYRTESGKMLAAMYMLQQGTPFIYQGQEIGMTNISLPDLDMYEDVFVKNNYNVFKKIFGKKRCEHLARISTRDNARTPVQWTGGENAGFTTGKPWFYINPNYKEVNAEKEMSDPNSLLNFYKKLIRFRKENEIVLKGDYKEYYANSKDLYVYERTYNNQRMLVICSFTEKGVAFEAPEGYDLSKGVKVLGNYESEHICGNGFKTRPYEMRVYMF